jgi:3-phosphoshikimate 1-carboxyvinyltransferase
MAVTVAALGAEGSVTVADAEAVKKSYPDFFEDMLSLGAVIKKSE